MAGRRRGRAALAAGRRRGTFSRILGAFRRLSGMVLYIVFGSNGRDEIWRAIDDFEGNIDVDVDQNCLRVGPAPPRLPALRTLLMSVRRPFQNDRLLVGLRLVADVIIVLRSALSGLAAATTPVRRILVPPARVSLVAMAGSSALAGLAAAAAVLPTPSGGRRCRDPIVVVPTGRRAPIVRVGAASAAAIAVATAGLRDGFVVRAVAAGLRDGFVARAVAPDIAQRVVVVVVIIRSPVRDVVGCLGGLPRGIPIGSAIPATGSARGVGVPFGSAPQSAIAAIPSTGFAGGVPSAIIVAPSRVPAAVRCRSARRFASSRIPSAAPRGSVVGLPTAVVVAPWPGSGVFVGGRGDGSARRPGRSEGEESALRRRRRSRRRNFGRVFHRRCCWKSRRTARRTCSWIRCG
mmetsp:Transcript_20471/g.49206  ORF Transcript_20471/g.49206 Transcript_20471/m.49206 type:complete len:405 (+) Transcript_20471:598-1812(+)